MKVCIAIIVILTVLLPTSALASKGLRYEQGTGVVAVNGHGAEYWHYAYVKEHHQRVRDHHPYGAGYAISLASHSFAVSEGAMRSLALCESQLSPRSRNASSGASGLFQFLSSTWARTPFARFSVFDPVANSLAAAWLYVHDGRSWHEWVCQP